MSADAIDLPSSGVARLRAVVARLRAPDGCPWDREQTVASVRRHLLDEVYEVLEALDGEGAGPEADQAAAEELGDLLFQIVFLSRLFEERDAFDLETVATRAADKMIARHPHVFGDRRLDTAEEVLRNWSDLKAEARGEKAGERSVLDGIPRALPALEKAHELAFRAGKQGFDWPAAAPVFDKVVEELGELRVAAEVEDAGRIGEELGDLLFAVANLGRKLGHNSEEELQRANRKFSRRFQWIEAALREHGRRPSEATLDELESLWREAKARER